MKRILFYTGLVLLTLTISAQAWFFGPASGGGFNRPPGFNVPGPDPGDALLLEGGIDFLLLEGGVNKLLLET